MRGHGAEWQLIPVNFPHCGAVKVCIISSCLDADLLRSNISSVKRDFSSHAMTADLLSSYRAGSTLIFGT